MQLNELPKRTNQKSKKMRIGRGYGSGKGGHTSTRGSKGQKSRTGHKSMQLFEGGNVPFYRRMPKFPGFNRPNRIEVQPVNVDILEENFEKGEVVSLETLREKGLIRKRTEYVKILGEGEIKKALKIEGLKVSKTAEEKILAAKGEIK